MTAGHREAERASDKTALVTSALNHPESQRGFASQGDEEPDDERMAEAVEEERTCLWEPPLVLGQIHRSNSAACRHHPPQVPLMSSRERKRAIQLGFRTFLDFNTSSSVSALIQIFKGTETRSVHQRV